MSAARLFDLFVPPQALANPEHHARARNLTGMAWMLALAAAYFTVKYYRMGVPAAAQGMAFAGLVAILIPLLHRLTGQTNAFRDFSILTINAALLWVSYINNGIMSSTLFWLAGIPVIAVFMGGLRAGGIWSGLMVIEVAVLSLLEKREILVPARAFPVEELPGLQTSSIIGLILALFGMAFLFERAKNAGFAQLAAARTGAEQTSRQLQGVLGEIDRSTAVGAAETAAIVERTRRVADVVAGQTAKANSTAAAVERMAQLSERHTQGTLNSAQEARLAEQEAQRWGEAIQRTVDDMQQVAVMVTQTASQMEQLGRFTREIGEIVDEIHAIARQTNLLALNAQIEAARAGEAGRGFAVVAEEVKNLADRTHEATSRVGERVHNVVAQTEQALDAMHLSTERVEQGRRNAAGADQGLREIVDRARRVSALIGEVAAAGEALSHENQAVAADVEQISRSMSELSGASTEIAQSVAKVDRMMSDLAGAVHGLKLS